MNLFRLHQCGSGNYSSTKRGRQVILFLFAESLDQIKSLGLGLWPSIPGSTADLEQLVNVCGSYCWQSSDDLGWQYHCWMLWQAVDVGWYYIPKPWSCCHPSKIVGNFFGQFVRKCTLNGHLAGKLWNWGPYFMPLSILPSWMWIEAFPARTCDQVFHR